MFVVEIHRNGVLIHVLHAKYMEYKENDNLLKFVLSTGEEKRIQFSPKTDNVVIFSLDE